MGRRTRKSAFVLDYAHADTDPRDPVTVRSDLSYAENCARVAAYCPWAAVIQQENCAYYAYEDAADAARGLERAKRMGFPVRTNDVESGMLHRIRLIQR